MSAPTRASPPSSDDEAALEAAQAQPQPSTAEMRRLRQRERMQRQRLAFRRDLELKRQQVERLSAQLAQLLTDGHDQHEEGAMVSLRRRYRELVQWQGALGQERVALGQDVARWQHFLHTVTVEQQRLARQLTVEPVDFPLRADGSRMLALPATEDDFGEPFVIFRPMDRETGLALVDEAYRRMVELQNEAATRADSGESFGWRVAYAALPTSTSNGEVAAWTLQHRFRKQIAGDDATVDALVRATWAVLHSPEQYASIYRSPMASQVVQRVDVDTSVLVRTYPDAHGRMATRLLSMLGRREDYVGHLRRAIVLVSVADPSQCLAQCPGTETNPLADTPWLTDGLGFLTFTAEAHGRVGIEYSGCQPLADADGADAVVGRIAEALVRWEQAVGPGGAPLEYRWPSNS